MILFAPSKTTTKRLSPRRFLQISALLLACSSLSACWSVGPDFAALKGSVLRSVGFSDTNADDHAQEKQLFLNASLDGSDDHAPHSLEAYWWERLEDPSLPRYVQALIADNLTLQQASERLIQARTQLVSADANFLPSLSADSSAGRSFSYNSSAQNRLFSDSYTAGLNASWQLDLFGKLRRTSESAKASLQASAYERDALAQSLIAALVEQRIALAAGKQLLEVTQDQLDRVQSLYELTQRRYNLGASGVGASDVHNAEQALEDVRANLHERKRTLNETLYALDVLLGKPPGTHEAADFFTLDQPLISAPSCLPVALLDRRPDLKASEARLRGANADIGVAVAQLYPDLTLGGGLGYESSSTASLFTADRLAGSILASVSARLFEGGALRANIRLQEAEARELAASYADEILVAMQEVENGLVAQRELARTLEARQRALATQTRNEALAQERYRQGVIALSDVLQAQQDHLTAKGALIEAQQEAWRERIALYLALGGDWFNRAEKDEDEDEDTSSSAPASCNAQPQRHKEYVDY